MSGRRRRLLVDGDVLLHRRVTGVEQYTTQLLRAVDRLLDDDSYRRFDVAIFVTAGHKRRLKRYGFSNIKVRTVPLPNRLVSALAFRQRLPPIDAFFGRRVYLFPAYLAWPLRRGWPIPVVYDLSFVNEAQFVEPSHQDLLARGVERSIRQARQVVTISEFSKSEIVQHYDYPAVDVRVVYPAVDRARFSRRLHDDVVRAKQQYGITQEYLLFVGTLEPRKNLTGVLDAYRLLPQELRDTYALLLVGQKGWLDDELNRAIATMRADGLSILRPHTFVEDEDLPAIYSGAAALVYVSHYEGFGIPPLEAMACGTPVIASDSTSLPEAVGDAAIRVDSYNSRAIAAAMQLLLTDSQVRERLVAAGYKQVSRFDWLESARRLLEIVETVSG